MKRSLLAFFFLIIACNAFSQSVLDSPVNNIHRQKSFIDFVIDLEAKRPIRFFFLDEWVASFTISPGSNGLTLREILDDAFSGTEVSYVFLFDYAVVLSKDPAAAVQREALLQHAYQSRKIIEEIILGDRKKDFVQGKNVTVKGNIVSETDNSRMQGVTVYVSDLKLSTTTDRSGSYSLTLPAGEHVVEFQHLNYAPKVLDLKAYKSGTVNIVMQEAPTVLSEVEVSDQAILSNRVSQTTIQIKDIKRAPAFLGEVDVIKNLQIQPGVTTVGEVAGGFNVRGGGVDQNLVLYEGVPVFNTSHALGFFTAFNSDAVNNVTFFRGGIPAEYGGRASSVLSISSREGNYRKWTGGGGIGIISSYVTAGGPIKPDTTSVIASFRSSYSNWMLDIFKSNYQSLENSSVSFYDGSLKLTHKFSEKTKLTIGGYSSFDEFSLSDDTLYSWRNFAGSIRVDHIFNERLFSTFSLAAGRYSYQFGDDDPENAFKLRYAITYPSFNADFNYNGPHTLSFGFQNTFYTFSPGELTPLNGQSGIAHIRMKDEKALESALYLSDGFYLKDNIFIELGLRYSMFNRIGPGLIYQYQPGASIERHNTVDSVQYGSGEIMKTYHGPEPRASLRYVMNDKSSLKFGYNRIYQYIHLITNTAAVTPVDVWQSSNSFFKPQRADQVSLGYYRNFKGNTYEAFAESYYKHINNILDFKDGAELILNEQLETALLNGNGHSYGIELSVSKISGRLQGFVNYTFSRSFREVDGRFDSERINYGKKYPSNYDQPHVANLNWRYGISRRHFFSGNFTYHTGRPISVPRSTYSIDGVPVADFSERNTSRIPDYHRLDIAFIIEGNHKLKKLWDGTWVFSFYNVYARRNAYSVFYRETDNRNLVSYKLSIIGTVIPSVTYSFKF